MEWLQTNVKVTDRRDTTKNIEIIFFVVYEENRQTDRLRVPTFSHCSNPRMVTTPCMDRHRTFL